MRIRLRFGARASRDNSVDITGGLVPLQFCAMSAAYVVNSWHSSVADLLASVFIVFVFPFPQHVTTYVVLGDTQ